jgi:glycosyltransferase involved in cell wall biosynthesis
VHPSTEREPFGLVIIEAMACGRPVITGRLGGSAEITGNDSGALEYSAGDPASLADQIVRLARDPALWRRLSLAGRASAQKKFDRTCLGPACAPLYESVVTRAAFGPRTMLTGPGGTL